MACSFPAETFKTAPLRIFYFNIHLKLLREAAPAKRICNSTDPGFGTMALKRNRPLR